MARAEIFDSHFNKNFFEGFCKLDLLQTKTSFVVDVLIYVGFCYGEFGGRYSQDFKWLGYLG